MSTPSGSEWTSQRISICYGLRGTYGCSGRIQDTPLTTTLSFHSLRARAWCFRSSHARMQVGPR